MKRIKKCGAVLLALIMLLSFVPITSAVNFEESTGDRETEPNNTAATATEISVNIPMTGNLYNTDDVDYYRFTTTEPGKIFLNFKHERLDNDGNFWEFMLFDNNETELVTYYSSGNATTMDTMDFYLGAGTYYIRVRPYSSYSYGFRSVEYTLTVNYEENTGDYEIEPNGTTAAATAMNVGKPITGNLNNSADVDFYKITFSRDFSISIRFTHRNLDNTRDYWNISVLDSTAKELMSFSSSGTETVKDSQRVNVKAGTHYIRVRASSSYNWSNADYTFTVNTGALVTHTVTFRDGSTILNRQQVLHGNAATPPRPTKKGYDFKSWDKSFNNITAALTVNATWTPKEYTVKFKNGKLVHSTQTVEYGKGAYAPWSPSKTGYTFKGWDKKFNKITKNLTLNARWKAKTIKLTFDALGGKIGKRKSLVVKNTYGKRVKLPKPPTRRRYKFKGWYTLRSYEWSSQSFNGSGTKVGKKTRVPLYNTTYYARWAKR
ncbi:MAG: InlB B-repeat-containing protein [Oscillospiraceae bacterium]|nr:InlB B-repeat-containing protein [Oscillospiraceae bacterium]